MNPCILIVVGSTGGHYFPGLALAETIREKYPEIKVKVAGESKVGNLGIWHEKGLDFLKIPAIGLPRGILKKIAFPGLFFLTIIRTMKVLRRERPDLVVGMGSYVAFFSVLAGRFSGRKTVVHEQNAVPGRANWLLNAIGVPTAVTFPETRWYLRKKLIRITGMPVRREFFGVAASHEMFGLDPKKKTILILGGSQGAHFLNLLAVQLARLIDQSTFQFIHLTGKNDFAFVRDAYAAAGFSALVKDFSFEVQAFFSIATVAVARAGAGTIAELVAKRVPSILIPYPYGRNHQRYNALYCEKKGICKVIFQEQATPDVLLRAITELSGEAGTIKKLFDNISIVDTSGALARFCLEQIYD
jgi:UDP-N-acetylglucosamine--N-acetylmuramyl-(pentapeptide) pyrophosphoryl-undecaprenol N-acetylglucosamine transferase